MSEQEVSGDKCAFAAEIKHGGIVANALLGGRLDGLDVFGEVANKSELA